MHINELEYHSESNGCEVIEVALDIAANPADYPEVVGIPFSYIIRHLKDDGALKCGCEKVEEIWSTVTKLKKTEQMYQEYLDEQENKKINKQFVKKDMTKKKRDKEN